MDVEFGRCDICKKETYISRKYYRYDIKCECHSPYHFVIVYHCKDCVPVEPTETTVTLKTSYIKNIEQEIRKEKIKRLNNERL